MEITNLKMKKCLNGGDAYRRKSIGEQIVASILDDLNINYFYDVSCDNLKGVKNGTLRFDFCIPIDQNCKTLNECLSSNGKYIILEYNGIFHYHIIKGKTTKYTLTKQQMNDYIKDAFCRLHKISILWIPYWYHAKSIQESVNDFISSYIIQKKES